MAIPELRRGAQRPSRPAEAPAPTSRPVTPEARPQTQARPVDAFEPARPTPTYGVGRRIDTLRADFNQGDSNACGTTALAIALHRLGTDIPRVDIDKDIRNFNLFTSRQGILDYARQSGFQAQQYNQGNFAQLQKDIAAGRQVVVLTDVGGRDGNGSLQRGSEGDFNLHYMVLTEADVAADGTPFVRFWNWGREETLPYAEFEKLWKDIHVQGVDTGYDRPYILVDRGEAAPLRASNSKDTQVADSLTYGISEVSNGVAQLARGSVREGGGRILEGVAQVGKGAVRALGGALKGLFD